MRRSARARTSLRASLNENELTRDTEMEEEGPSSPPPADEKEEGGHEEAGAKRKRGRPRSSAPSSSSSSSSSRRRPSSPSSPSAADGEQIDDEDLPPLFLSLATSSVSIKSLSREWATRFSRESTQDEALSLLSNCLLAVGGTSLFYSPEEINGGPGREKLVRNAGRTEYIADALSPLLKYKKLGARLEAFLRALVEEAKGLGLFSPAAAGGNLIVECAGEWAKEMSRSDVRNFRLAGTKAAMDLMGGLVAVGREYEGEISVKKKQLEQLGGGGGEEGTEGKAPAKSSKEYKQYRAVEQDLSLLSSSLDNVKKELEHLFKEVFVHRYRDVDEGIRALCMESLGRFLLSFPSLFLSDMYLKYVGWTLNDRAVAVRRASLLSVLSLYQRADAPSIARLDLFTRRFLRRFQEMCMDADEAVAAAAIRLLTCLLRCGLLSERDGEGVPGCMWDRSETVREAAVEFVREDTFGEEEGEKGEEEEEKGGRGRGSAERLRKHAEDLIQLMNIFDKYCPLSTASSLSLSPAAEGGEGSFPGRNGVLSLLSSSSHLSISGSKVSFSAGRSLTQAMDTLVEGFWEHLKCLKDWGALTKLLLSVREHAEKEEEKEGKKGKKKGRAASSSSSSADEIDESLVPSSSRQFVLLSLLLSIARYVAGKSSAFLPGGPFFSHPLSKQKEVELRQDRESLSIHLQTALPLLLTTYGADARKAALLVQLPQFLSLPLYEQMKKKKEWEELLAALRSVYFKHGDSALLVPCGATFAALFDAAEERSDGATAFINGMADEALRAFSSRAGEDLDVDNEEGNRALFVILSRMAGLARPLHLPQLAWSPALDNTLRLFSLRCTDPLRAAIVSLFLHLCFSSLLWDYCSIDHQQPSRAALSRVAAAAAVLFSHLERCSHSVDAYSVRDTAFRLIADLFVLFSAKLQGTAEGALAIDDKRIKSLSEAFNLHLKRLIGGGDIDERMEREEEEAARQDAAVERGEGPAAEDAAARKQRREAFRESLLSSVRVDALLCAVRVVIFDQPPSLSLRHLHSAALLLSCFHRFGPSEDAVIRRAMAALRKISPSLLLQAQLSSLKYSFEHHVDVPELKEQAGKFVLLHPLNPEKREQGFAGLLRAGIKYACSSPPHVVPLLRRAHSLRGAGKRKRRAGGEEGIRGANEGREGRDGGGREEEKQGHGCGEEI